MRRLLKSDNVEKGELFLFRRCNPGRFDDTHINKEAMQIIAQY
jgi:hypothetical protein